MKVIRTTEGYMVEMPDGDYLCNMHDDNLWDTRAEAEEVIAQAQGKPTTIDMTAKVSQYESVKEAFDAECGELEFVDNYRIAEVGNAQELAEYAKRMEAGCCGSRDLVVSIAHEYKYESAEGMVEGKYYRLHLIGCNYGH